MIEIAVLIASALGIAGWLVLRRATATALVSPRTGEASDIVPGAAALATASIEAMRLNTANNSAADRLWRLAFGAPSQGRASESSDRLVRDNILSMLQVDTLDPNYFPRRPALMLQLMQAVDDPSAASDRLSRIIARDPVLTADVLRLASSNLYRTSPEPIETIQRAIGVCGVEALRGILAVAMMRPVFRATRKNFPRLPRMLWERTEHATRMAELYAMETSPGDRFEAQLVVLLNALGPLVVYSASLDVYSRNPDFSPNPALFVDLIGDFGSQMAQRIARDWETSPRLVAALEQSGEDSLTTALRVGELLGTLSFLESQTVISREERCDLMNEAGIPAELASAIWAVLSKDHA